MRLRAIQTQIYICETCFRKHFTWPAEVCCEELELERGHRSSRTSSGNDASLASRVLSSRPPKEGQSGMSGELETPIRTDNDFLIGSNGTNLAAMLPVHITSREQALRTAAWISVMGESLPSEEGGGMDRVTFEDVREAILNT